MHDRSPLGLLVRRIREGIDLAQRQANDPGFSPEERDSLHVLSVYASVCLLVDRQKDRAAECHVGPSSS